MGKPPINLTKGYTVITLCILFFSLLGYYISSKYPEVVDIASPPSPTETPANKKNYSLFSFNPNTIDSSILFELDIPYWCKKNILKYRSKGGQFKTKSDVKKIYGINDSIYQALHSYIDIPTQIATEKKVYTRKACINPRKKAFQRQFPINLNTAPLDSLKIRGLIGEKRALAILNKRNKLGGFFNIEQIKELYNISDSIYELVKHKYAIDVSDIRKRSLDSISKGDLYVYSFLNKFQIKHIIASKQISASIKTVEDLRQNKIIDSVTYSRLRHYIK